MTGKYGKLPFMGRIRIGNLRPKNNLGFHLSQGKIQDGIRKTYDGPLTLAKDMLVWNVTKEDIKVREVVYNENVWTAPIVNKGVVDTSLWEPLLYVGECGVAAGYRPLGKSECPEYPQRAIIPECFNHLKR